MAIPVALHERKRITIMNTSWPSPARLALSAHPDMPNALLSLLYGSVGISNKH